MRKERLSAGKGPGGIKTPICLFWKSSLVLLKPTVSGTGVNEEKGLDSGDLGTNTRKSQAQQSYTDRERSSV